MSVYYSVIVLDEKHSQRFFLVRNGECEEVAREILQQRLKAGYWYDEEAEEQAREDLKNGHAWRFLQSRDDHEYEGIEEKFFSNE